MFAHIRGIYILWAFKHIHWKNVSKNDINSKADENSIKHQDWETFNDIIYNLSGLIVCAIKHNLRHINYNAILY